jgi:hypothetical protein
VISTACYSVIFADKIKYDGQQNRWVQVPSQACARSYPADRSVSGRFQNTAFFRGFIESLANLRSKRREPPKRELFRTEPYSYSTAPSDTQVASLLLRKFADFPIMDEDKTARARNELNIDYLSRNFPKSAAIPSTTPELSFALDMIEDEHTAFGAQATDITEGNFECFTRTRAESKIHVADILKGMLIRGRLQMSCLETFLHLCHSGKCSLKALELPIEYFELPIPGTADYWVMRALSCFMDLQTDWQDIQNSWSIKETARWVDYDAPLIWLITVITRSSTDLYGTLDHIRIIGALGTLNTEAYSAIPSYEIPWKPNPKYRIATEPSASGTFAFWLPDGIRLKGDFDTDTTDIYRKFVSRLTRVEMAYTGYFELDGEAFRQFAKGGTVDPRGCSPEAITWYTRLKISSLRMNLEIRDKVGKDTN